MQTKLSKKALAKKLGISRSSLYYSSKMKVRDQRLKEQILAALSEHPSYGHRRLAIHLGRNRKCVLRVVKKYDIKPYRRRVRRPRKKGDLSRDPLCVPNYGKIIVRFREVFYGLQTSRTSGFGDDTGIWQR